MAKNTGLYQSGVEMPIVDYGKMAKTLSLLTPIADPMQGMGRFKGIVPYQATEGARPYMGGHTPLYTGYGRAERGSVYNATEAPVAGPGKYYGFTQDVAKQYGPTVDRASAGAVVKNPMVIRNDQQWRALTKEAGWEFPNPFGKSGAEQQKMTKALQDKVKAKGYDGMVIEFDAKAPTDRVGEDWIKTLRDVFGDPQVISFAK